MYKGWEWNPQYTKQRSAIDAFTLITRYGPAHLRLPQDIRLLIAKKYLRDPMIKSTRLYYLTIALPIILHLALNYFL